MSRIGFAAKTFASALLNYKSYNEHGERFGMRTLPNFGFGKKDLETVVKEGFATNTHVYSIINRIAESAADIPVTIKSTNSKGETEEITSGDFYNFVHNPNEDDNYKTFVYKSLVYQLATGNELIYGVQGIGAKHFSEAWNLAPQYIEPKTVNLVTGPKATKYLYSYSDKTYTLLPDEVMHLRKFNPDPADENAVMGLSPLQAAANTVKASNATLEADASLIENKGAFGAMVAKGERPVTKEQGEDVDKALKKKIGGSKKYGKIVVTSGNFDFIKFAMSPQDLQILENQVMKLRDICSVYGVSSRLFNDPNGTTFNNSKEDGKAFYTRGVLPPLENHLDYFNRFFIPGWNERDNTTYTIELDLSGIDALQEDQSKSIIKSRNRSTIITNILKGIGRDWSEESAVAQLMDALNMTEEEARTIVDKKPNNGEE